jgi:hypothetical protein
MAVDTAADVAVEGEGDTMVVSIEELFLWVI